MYGFGYQELHISTGRELQVCQWDSFSQAGLQQRWTCRPSWLGGACPGGVILDHAGDCPVRLRGDAMSPG
jgi:hypothetical protein